MRVRPKKGFRSLITDGRIHQGIEEGEEYLVLEVGRDYFRIWDRAGEPIIYPKELFEVPDSSVPSGWVFEEFAEGEYWLGPSETSEPGFYEDYFGSDGDLEAQRKNQAIVRELIQRLRSP